MPDVKIKELPIKLFENLEDTNIILIEDATDTYQITLEQIKMYFTGDNKINDALTEINNKIDSFKQEVNEKVQQVIDSNTALNTAVTNLSADHENTKLQLGALTEKVTGIENNVTEINTHLENNDSLIEGLTTKTEDHETRITALEALVQPTVLEGLIKDNEQNKKDIAKLREDLDALSEHVDTSLGDLGTDEEGNPLSVQQYVQKMYDELMKYIDYYHHVSTNPPNFDEPYAGDPHVSTFVYPVGTIFETTTAPNEDGTCELINAFPGTWRYLGVATTINAEGNPVANRYTWERIE